MAAAMKELVSSQTEVGLRLTREVLSNRLCGGRNAVFSPLSIHVLLSMAAAGTSGAGRERLLSFLKAKSVDDLHNFSSEVVSTLFVNHQTRRTSAREPKLTAANGVWIDSSLSLKPYIKHVLHGSYKAVARTVDFRNKREEVVREVNVWAEKATNGLIKQALELDAVDSETSIVLANTIYFKAAWFAQFERSRTKDGEFFLLDGTSITASFMNSNKDSAVLSVHDGFKILRVPYCGSLNRSFRMYFLLPDERDGLPGLLDKVCTEPGFLDQHEPRPDVKVKEYHIPKFKIELGLEASSILSKMGVELGFMNEMVEHVPKGWDIFPSSMIHKAAIEVNEEGTEAAAFSGMVLAGCSPMKPQRVDFIADHPFMYMIREEVTGIVLFTGQVLDPSQGRIKN